jgi:hypothetical protein
MSFFLHFRPSSLWAVGPTGLAWGSSSRGCLPAPQPPNCCSHKGLAGWALPWWSLVLAFLKYVPGVWETVLLNRGDSLVFVNHSCSQARVTSAF